MRTVDILIAVHALFSDKTNWTSGSLIDTYEGEGDNRKSCFCALGGILKEGGILVPTHYNPSQFTRRAGFYTESTVGLAGFTSPDDGHFVSAHELPKLSKSLILKLEKSGAHVTQTVNAARYLQEAMNTLAAKRGLQQRAIWKANDNFGYEFVMDALVLAIRNAKRRHVTGDRKKTVAVANQAVAQ
jgi:hypothetical protein